MESGRMLCRFVGSNYVEILILPDSGAVATESEFKLCSTCATVLGMQMEG